MITQAWLILWIPFVCAVVTGLFLRRWPKLCSSIAIAGILAGFLLTLNLLFQMSSAHTLSDRQIESSILWMNLGSLTIEFGILLNGLTLLMLLIVTGVGTLIFIYSTSYMEHDESYARYFSFLSLFAFSMLGIVLSNNLIQTFIFWELVGLSSYLLIGFWYQKPAAATAGKKAFLTTRVGDIGMMIGILVLFGFLAGKGFPTFNFALIQERLLVAEIPAASMTAIALLIFLGVVGKSAQVPLHVWLPDAMEGPTPVSALIHAATMVAAGVFLLARLDFIFAASPTALTVIAWTGGITALLAATVAVVQNDIKRILAYSTLSQLGYMVMALGLGSSAAGMFHLTTHAFFKALLFLGAGSFIHALHTQNIFEMPVQGGLIKKMPITSLTFLIGTLALMGIPPLSGYFSKEEILGVAYHGSMPLFILAAITVFFTAFYSGRLFAVAFSSSPTSEKGSREQVHESNWKMTVPLILLCALSIFGGFLPLHHLLPQNDEGHHGASLIAAISIALSILGFVLAYLMYRGKAEEKAESGVKGVLSRKYFFDDFYDSVLVRGIQQNLARLSDLFERSVVIETGINRTGRMTRGFGDWLRQLETGVVQFYALIFTVGVTFLIYVFILVGRS
jgi:NADH-quinone oxidoreductase subunit L